MTNRQIIEPPPPSVIEYALKSAHSAAPYLAMEGEGVITHPGETGNIEWTDSLMGAWGTESFAEACSQAALLMAARAAEGIEVFSIRRRPQSAGGLIEGPVVLVLP